MWERKVKVEVPMVGSAEEERRALTWWCWREERVERKKRDKIDKLLRNRC